MPASDHSYADHLMRQDTKVLRRMSATDCSYADLLGAGLRYGLLDEASSSLITPHEVVDDRLLARNTLGR